MKYLKIEQNKGHFMSSEGTYLEIDNIDKNELMFLVNEATEKDEFEILTNIPPKKQHWAKPYPKSCESSRISL